MKDINATVIVPILQDEEQMFRDLQKDARWGIKKAKREGLVVDIVNDERSWSKFYEIYVNELKEKNVKAETFEHIKEHGHVLFICKKEYEVIAGATLELGKGLKGSPKLSRNASLPEFLKLQPNNLLYWHCMLWCKDNKYDKLDLGGWQIKATGNAVGVNRFKERWGDIVYYKADYPASRIIVRRLIRNFGFFRKLSKKLKKQQK